MRRIIIVVFAILLLITAPFLAGCKYLQTEVSYSVEYYFDGILDNSKTEILTGKVGDTITEIPNKTGADYKIDPANPANIPFVLSGNPEENIIKVYYLHNLDTSLWYRYSFLSKTLQNAYIELYTAYMAWITDENAPGTFIYEMTTPGFTWEDRYFFGESIFADHALINDFCFGFIAYPDEKVVYETDISEYYFGSHAKMVQLIHEIESAADEMLSGLNDDMSDYDKYRFIADKLCQTITYSYDLYDETFSGNTQSDDEEAFIESYIASGLYGALVDKTTICSGYAAAYQYLCNRAGLWCFNSLGTTEGGVHQWNIIRLDDGYYNVDVTWMDSGNADRYFCLTDEQIAVDHDCLSSDIPECTAQKYAYNNGSISNL